MGKVVKIAAAVVGVAALVIPGVGAAITGAIYGGLFGGAVGTVGAIGLGIGQALTATLALTGITAGLGMATRLLGLGPKPPKQSPASQDRLRASIDPRAYRKIVLGRTAAAVDVRYQEFTGSDQEYLNSIVALASHKLHAIDEVWFDEKLAWSSGGGIGSDFTGYLEVTVRAEGTAANAVTITGSSSWTSASSRFAGNAYLWLRYKLTGNGKKAESPFSSSVTSRITVRVRGAVLYDPRLDSTQPGGSGSHRADDQSTWAWVSDDVGRNPALQLLWYLLGWRIADPADGTLRLAVGLGLPAARIDLASFAAAANLCDEPVTLAAGGTEPRYRADGVFSEGDDPSLVFDNLLAAMNGTLRDAGGKLVLEVLHDDLATPVVDLTEGDVIGQFAWVQTPPIDQQFNVVRGRYVDATDAGLYQMVDFPEVSLASPDGIERVQNMDLPTVQSASQAQRLAKQFLQRAQYPGTFSADFLASAWRCEVGSVVRLTFPALGFSNKLFRVIEHAIRLDGTCPMTLREEAAAIYAWDAEESPAVTAASPTAYDPLNDPFVQALADTLQLTIRNAAVLNPRDASDVSRALLIATDAGSNATISVAKHDWDYPDGTVDVTRALGTITGLAFATDYYVYFDDATLANGAPTYAATANLADAQNTTANPGRHPLGKITTPADGAGPTYGGAVPGYGYFSIADLDTAGFANKDELNDYDGTAVTAPTVAADGTALSYAPQLNGACDITGTWSFSGTLASIDGFEISFYAATSSSAFTAATTPVAGEQRWTVDKNAVKAMLRGAAQNLYYTFSVRAWRRVSSTIAASGILYSAWVKTTLGSQNPYRPNSTPGIENAMLVAGVAASSVKDWAGYANAGLNSDGTVKSNKVSRGAIVNGELVNSGYTQLGTTVTLTASDAYVHEALASRTINGTDLVIRAQIPFYVVMTDPVKGNLYYVEFRVRATNTGTSTTTVSRQIIHEYRWDFETATGTKYSPITTQVIEEILPGLASGTYDIGYSVLTPSTNGAVFPPYRYIIANDRRKL